MTDENTTYSEDTLRKVYEALLENGIFGQKATDIVNSIHNKRVIFREHVGKRRGRPPGSKNKQTQKPAAEVKTEPEKALVAPVEGVSEDAWSVKDGLPAVPELPQKIRDIAEQNAKE